MKPYNTIEKYKRSEYLREYNEITEIYNSQIKPLKNPFLIAFIAVFTTIGTIIFAYIVIYILQHRNNYLLTFRRRRIRNLIGAITISAFLIYFIPGTYFIRLSQVISHKDRRIENLEEKKAQAVSAGIYDANS